MKATAAGPIAAARCELSCALACGTGVFSDSNVKQPTLRRPLVVARGLRLGPFPLEKARGMERWTALARLTDAPGGSPRSRADLRKFGRRSPAPNLRGDRRAF